MKLTEMWKNRETPTLSFEFYPARNAEAEAKLERVIDQLLMFQPDFVSVTFGAGGSTREGSRQLVDKLITDKGVETVAYFAGYGLSPGDIESVLDTYQELGVDNLLVVRGDPPHGVPDFKPHPESLAHASAMISYIRPRYHFCLGAAGYPEGHIEAKSKELDLEYLKLKMECGADFIISNYFYDNQYFFDFVEKAQAQHIMVPIIPGIMPIFNLKMMENLAKLCGATITPELRRGLAELPPDDPKALLNFGIEFAARQCTELIEAGTLGLHFYTMDRSPATAGVISRLRRAGML